MTGTNDVRGITVSNTSHTLIAQYFEHSVATGVLIVFIYISENRSVNFSRSSYLSLDRNTSLNYTLPDDLTPGLYRVFAYDIESNGTLHNGVTYPASTGEFELTGNIHQGQGSLAITYP